MDRSKVDELTKDLAKKHSLTVEPGGFLTVDMDSPVFPELALRLARLHDDQLVFPANGFIRLKLVDSSTEPAAWFEYEPKWELTHISEPTGNKFDLLSCKADAARPGKRLGKSLLGVYANEEFKALVEQLGFTGLEFVWAQDKGFYDAPQWYWLNLTHGLGRGLDFECFDATKWQPHASEASPEWRCGKTWFDKSQLKDSAPFSSKVKNRFVSLFPESSTDRLRFRAYRRYVKRFLPNTDFAYGREGRASFFCFSRRVRDALLANNFVTADECTPIMTLDAQPTGIDALDELGIPLPRYCLTFEQDELQQIKITTAAAERDFAASPKPKRQATLEEVLKQLHEASRGDPDRFHAGVSEAQIADAGRSLPEELPKAWREILKVANGFTFEMGDPFEVVPLGDLEAYSKDTQVGAKAGNPDFPDRLIHVTHGFSGDFHSLDLCSVTTTGECKVIEFDHETLQPHREWPSIALFIHEVLRH